MSIQAKLHHLQATQNLLAPYRYLYCVDLEATCDEVDESESPRPLAVVHTAASTLWRICSSCPFDGAFFCAQSF